MVNVSKITVNGNNYDIKDTEARSGLSNKQDTLISGTNIKTVNGNSLLGSGDLTVGGSVDIDEETITKNNDNKLQVVAVKNKRDDSTLGIWHGTEYQWNHGAPTTWYYWQTTVQAMWQSGGNLPSSADWRSIAYGDGKFVAVAEYSAKSAYSTDGINWTETTMPSSARWKSVAYGDGKFIAVADNSNQAAYSTDGINWTSYTLPSEARWQSVTYGDGKFVAVTWNSDEVAYSIDGINWVASTSPNSAGWGLVTYGNGKFVVMFSGSDQAAYSTDGITWSAFTLPSSENWQSVTYGDGKFVAMIIDSNKAAYSTDGINWTALTMPSFAGWCSVTYGDGKFVAVALSSNKAAYSTDGINWTESTLPSSANWYSVTYGDGKFVAVPSGSDASAIFTVQYDKCYTNTANPTTTSIVYSEPETVSSYTISSVTSGAITLSNNNTYYYNQSGNAFTYRTIGDAHPEYLAFIDGVGIKKGNTLIASATPITTTITSSSTDTEVPSAKAVYNEVGEVENLLNNINSGE